MRTSLIYLCAVLGEGRCWSPKMKVKGAQSCLTLRDPMVCSLPGSSVWVSSGKNTGVIRHFFLQGIFPTQGSNCSLLHCRQILYCLSYQFIMSQVTIFSSQSSRGRASSHLTFNIPHTTPPREQVEEAVSKGRAYLLEHQFCVNGRCYPNVIYLSSFWQSLRSALLR